MCYKGYIPGLNDFTDDSTYLTPVVAKMYQVKEWAEK